MCIAFPRKIAIRRVPAWSAALILVAAAARSEPLAKGWLYEYDIYINDKLTGSSCTEITLQEEHTEIRERITYTETGMLDQTNVSLSRIEHFTASGRLLFADVKHIEDKTKYWSRMERVDDEIWAVTSPITSATEKEDAQFINLALAALGDASASAGEILSYSSLLFGDDQANEGDNRFPDTDYQTSLQFLPLYWLHQGRTLPDTIDLLDIPHFLPRQVTSQTFTDAEMPGDCYSLELSRLENLTACIQQAPIGPPHFSLLRRSTPGRVVEFRTRIPEENNGDKPIGERQGQCEW